MVGTPDAAQPALLPGSARRRADLLVRRIGLDHPRRADLADFIGERFGPGVRPDDLRSAIPSRTGLRRSPTPLQRRPFRLVMVSPGLTGVAADADLTRAQLDEAITGMGNRSDAEIIRSLGLTPGQRRTAQAWLDGVRQAAARDAELRSHLGGGGTTGGTPEQRVERLLGILNEALTGAARVQGLELLEALDSDELARVAEQGALHGLLEQRIPVTDPLRVRANRFLSDRLDAGGLDVGPRLYPLPARPAAPSAVRTFLSPEQLRQARADLRGASNVAIVRRLGLSEPESQRAGAWLTRLREAIRREDALRPYLDGHPDAALTAAQQRDLAEAALRGLTPWQALEVLNAADDTELDELTRDGGLLALARTVIHEGHPLRPELDLLLTRRFTSEGRVVPGIQPAGGFNLDMIHPRLADVPFSGQPSREDVITIGRHVSAVRDLPGGLPSLPPVSLARARWWDAHVACRPGRSGRPRPTSKATRTRSPICGR